MLALAMVLVLSSLAFASGGSSAETELVINILPYSEVTAPESLELTISKPGVADRNGNDNPHKIKVAANMPVKWNWVSITTSGSYQKGYMRRISGDGRRQR